MTLALIHLMPSSVDSYKKVEEDGSLQEKLKALDKKAVKALDTAINELVEIARAEGFVFTSQDLVEARSQKPETSEHIEPWARSDCEVFTGVGCMPGMGLYVTVPVPVPPPDPPNPPSPPGCESTYKLDCVGHIFR